MLNSVRTAAGLEAVTCRAMNNPSPPSRMDSVPGQWGGRYIVAVVAACSDR